MNVIVLWGVAICTLLDDNNTAHGPASSSTRIIILN